MAAPWDDPHVGALLDLALAEDVGAGDRTSEALVPAGARARGRLRAKQALVVCGLPLLERVFARLGGVRVVLEATEGARAARGQVLATLEGEARALLAGERVALNLLQHLCGIATLTRAYVERVRGTPLVVRECRTLAEVRAAVGAAPDLILLDNMPAGEVAKAVDLARGRVPLEASGGVTLEQLQALAGAGVDFVAVGAITHSAPAADLNLKIEPLP